MRNEALLFLLLSVQLAARCQVLPANTKQAASAHLAVHVHGAAVAFGGAVHPPQKLRHDLQQKFDQFLCMPLG